jgi:hypothetical protein
MVSFDFRSQRGSDESTPSSAFTRPSALFKADSSYHTRREAATGTPMAALHIESAFGTMQLVSIIAKAAISAMKACLR